jgi:hypothetical protein
MPIFRRTLYSRKDSLRIMTCCKLLHRTCTKSGGSCSALLCLAPRFESSGGMYRELVAPDEAVKDVQRLTSVLLDTGGNLASASQASTPILTFCL